MALKYTKVTGPKITGERWRSLVHVRTTASASTASRSAKSELRVCAALTARKWTVLFHDVRCARVQVDILARDPQGVLTVVEVKSQSTAGLGHLARAQARRLWRVSQALAQYEPVQIVLVLVEDGKVHLLPVDGLTDI